MASGGSISWGIRHGGTDKRNAQQAFGPLASFPQGARHPIAWQMAQKNGGMSSHNMSVMTLTPTATVIMGLNGAGAGAISLDAQATGQLVAAAIASGGIVFTASGSILALLNGDGTATVNITAAADVLAHGWMSATAYTVANGALVSYALGHMDGTTEDLSGLTPEAIAAAVWNSLVAQFSESGSMGEALGSAGTAGDPWTTDLPGSYIGNQAGAIIGQKLLTTGKFLALK